MKFSTTVVFAILGLAAQHVLAIPEPAPEANPAPVAEPEPFPEPEPFAFPESEAEMEDDATRPISCQVQGGYCSRRRCPRHTRSVFWDYGCRNSRYYCCVRR